jgi:glycerol-3-phosphate acyltransferase PlsY
MTLFMVVLIVEVVKGILAVVVGARLAGDWGAVFAGIGAAMGNVYNVWYRFRGGKGLAISLGILLAAWPTMVPVILVVLGVAAAVSRSSGIGTLVTLAVLVVAGLTWEEIGLGNAWGVEDSGPLLVLSVGISLILWKPHWHDTRTRLRQPAPL